MSNTRDMTEYANGYRQAMIDIAEIIARWTNPADADEALRDVTTWVRDNGGSDVLDTAAEAAEHVCTTECMIGGHLDTAPATSVRLANGAQVWVKDSDLPPVRGDFPSAEYLAAARRLRASFKPCDDAQGHVDASHTMGDCGWITDLTEHQRSADAWAATQHGLNQRGVL